MSTAADVVVVHAQPEVAVDASSTAVIVATKAAPKPRAARKEKVAAGAKKSVVVDIATPAAATEVIDTANTTPLSVAELSTTDSSVAKKKKKTIPCTTCTALKAYIRSGAACGVTAHFSIPQGAPIESGRVSLASGRCPECFARSNGMVFTGVEYAIGKK